jgi:hypothetical protein
MRFHEFNLLLEYNRQKTAQSFGNKILVVFKYDTSYHSDPVLTQGYHDINYVEIDKVPQQTISLIIEHVLAAIEEADPTNHKEYAQWLAKVYAAGKTKLEDIQSKGSEWLEIFHQLKNRKILPQEYRDINRMSFSDLGDLVHVRELVDKLKVAQKPEERGNAQSVYENNSVRIIIPEDETAACYYGRGTRWCTAAKNYNRYDQYSRQGNLYILLPKNPEYDGEKYQLHFQSGQFMDEEDNMIPNIKQFLETRFGNLIPVFKEIEPSINGVVIFAEPTEIMTLVADIKEKAMENVYDILNDMEMNDDSYHDYLSDQGYQDDEGEIDWEAVEKNHDDWLSYNDYARELKNEFEEALSPSIDEVFRCAELWGEENEELLLIGNLEYAIAGCIDENMSSKQYGNYKEDMIYFIKRRIRLEKNADNKWTAHLIKA